MTRVVLPAASRLVVLTGAGISAESGIATFRDAGGLWERHRVEDVATPEAWERDPALVWRFYSARRRQAREAEPNPAHRALAELEARLGDRFLLVTQNVDDLHERAGSSRVIHMHGELRKTRCESCEREPFVDDALHEAEVPRCERCDARLRPHIVWFGEMPFEMHRIERAVQAADVFVTVGSSGAVYPAAGLVREMTYRRRMGERVHTLYVGLERPENAHEFDEIVLGKAGELLPSLFEVA